MDQNPYQAPHYYAELPQRPANRRLLTLKGLVVAFITMLAFLISTVVIAVCFEQVLRILTSPSSNVP